MDLVNHFPLYFNPPLSADAQFILDAFICIEELRGIVISIIQIHTLFLFEIMTNKYSQSPDVGNF